MYFIILLIFILYFIKYLYFRYLLHILDWTAHIFAKIIIFFNIKNRNNIIDYNLNLILNINKVNNLNIKSIIFKSNKLAILNAMLAFHQRYVIDTNYIIKYYSEFKIPKELEFDLKHNKCIFAMAHYGIYYDFSSFYTLFSPLACIYKISNTIIENQVYNSKYFKGKILPIKHNKLKDYLHKDYLHNDYPLICILCDQKTSGEKHKINFLGQSVKFHTSPVIIHKITKRSLWVFFCKYNFKTKKIDIKLIPIQRTVNNNNKYIITQKIANLFTEEILNNPEQYFWSHNRFSCEL